MIKPSVIVHGGAARIARADVDAFEAACHRAVEAALACLSSGASAIDAAVEAVVILEDDPAPNAGRGSVLNLDGELELDALLMEGSHLAVGAVIAVQDIANPIHLARELMALPDVNVLVGVGASRFARTVGIPPTPQEALITDARRELFERGPASLPKGDGPADTVGAVVIDSAGRTAAAVSTGGRPFQPVGRVGDVPMVGSGAYADDAVGAAVATGVGEGIMRVCLAKSALDLLTDETGAMAAADLAIQHLDRRVEGSGGIIMIDRFGEIGFAFNTPQMSYAHGCLDGRITVGH